MGTNFKAFEQDKPEYLRKLLTQIEPQWHGEFERFVETGEANDAFLTYLDQNETAQLAVEGAFKQQAARFEELADALKQRHDLPAQESATVSAAASTTPTKVATIIEGALQASSTQRAHVVARSTAALAASMPAEEAVVVKEVAESLESSIAEAAQAAR